MAVKVKLSQVLQPLAGNRETIDVTGNTVGQCLKEIISLFPGTSDWIIDERGILQALVLINGEALPPDQLNRAVGENDQLYILTMIGGG